jgi:hypothetical protein
LLERHDVGCIWSILCSILRPPNRSPKLLTPIRTTTEPVSSSVASEVFRSLVDSVINLTRHRREHVVSTFPQLVTVLSALASLLRRAGYTSRHSRRLDREAAMSFPDWAWQGGVEAFGRKEASAYARLLSGLTVRAPAYTGGSGPSKAGRPPPALTGPLSKHAPFFLLSYLRACAHPLAPIPPTVRAQIAPGVGEVVGAMGVHEREALMGGFLSKDDDAERALLRAIWRDVERERYKGG